MNENEQTNEQTQEVNNFNNYNVQNPAPKKKGKGLLIFAIMIVVIIAALVGGYAYITTPAQYYKLATTSMMKNISNNIFGEEYETAKTKLKLDVELEQELEMVDEEIIDLINDLTLELGIQEDQNQQQLVIDLAADYQKDDLIDGQIFIDAKNEKSYMYVQQLLDKYLELEIEDDTTYSELIEAFETDIALGQKINAKKMSNIIGKELSKSIKAEYCSSEQVTIKVNSEDIKTSCKTIKMTPEQVIDSLITICDNLSKNEEFIDLIKDEYKEDVKQSLEACKEELETAKEDLSEDMIIKLNTYTTGLLPQVVKVELVLETEEAEDTLIIEATKLEEQKYSYAVKAGEETALKGTISTGENVIKFSIEIEELGSLEVAMEATQEFDVAIDTIDVNNTASVEQLTEQELETLEQNFLDSKLYELINEFVPEDTTSSPFDEDTSYDSLFGEDSLDEEDSSNSIFNTEENDDSNSLFNTEVESEDTNDNESALQNNQIYTYDDKILITFGNLAGYEYDRISENYQTLTKDNIEITITSEYTDESEYYNQLKSTKEYFEEQSYYSDVTLSNKTTAQIAGKTFYKATLAYKFGSIDNKLDYIWTKVSDNYVIEVEISHINNMTNEELQQLLTINTENK